MDRLAWLIIAQNPALGAFMSQIRHGDRLARETAISEAYLLGSAAIIPLGETLGGEDPAAAKAAQYALEAAVHHASRPGAPAEVEAATNALLTLTDRKYPWKVRSTALHLLGLVGGRTAVPTLERLLADTEVREDARMALERIPHRAAEAALRRAAATAPADFRAALQQSLRQKRSSPRTVGTTR
ncbi:HEAT repeat domain-containing protein [Pseudothermotoga sp.]